MLFGKVYSKDQDWTHIEKSKLINLIDSKRVFDIYH